MQPIEMTQAKLEIMRSLETFLGGATSAEVSAESSIRGAAPILLHLYRYEGYVDRETIPGSRSMRWFLTDAGREFLSQAEGKIVARCKYCEKSWLVPEMSAEEYKSLRCDCGNKLASTKILYSGKKLTFPAEEGEPPTRINRRNKVVYTYDPYVDKDGVLRCGAQSTMGRPCRAAVTESGRSRCRMHIGRSKGRPLVSGRYSKYLVDTLADRYKDFAEDKDLLDLRDEIALLRAKAMEDPDASLRTMSTAMDTIGRLVSKVVEREEGLRVRISVDRIEVVVNLLTAIVVEELSGGCPHCGGDLSQVRSRLAERLLPENLVLFEDNKDQK